MNPEVQTARYHDEGGEFIVQILRDETSEGTRTVLLRCVETLKPSPMFGPIRSGAEFEVTCVLGYEAYVGWHLEPVEASA